MAREAGAKNVYFVSASPEVRYPNVYGINISTHNELVAPGKLQPGDPGVLVSPLYDLGPEDEAAWDLNITGVPAMVVENKFMIPGAQPAEATSASESLRKGFLLRTRSAVPASTSARKPQLEFPSSVRRVL